MKPKENNPYFGTNKLEIRYDRRPIYPNSSHTIIKHIETFKDIGG